MLFLAGIPVRAGYDKKLGFLLTKRIKHEKQKGEKHEADYNFDLLSALGIDTASADRKPYITPSEGERGLVDAVLKDLGIRRDIITLHPGASCPSKRWSPKEFAKVADALSEKYAADIVLVGGDETSHLSAEVISGMKSKAFDVTGNLLVGELAELLSRSRLFISNDSGPVHVAVAVGTPVISIFGRRDPGLSPKRWGPLGAGDRVVHRDVGCEECFSPFCFSCFILFVRLMPAVKNSGALRLLRVRMCCAKRMSSSNCKF